MKAKRRPRRSSFDLKTFLATVSGGRTVSTYRKNKKVFSQGDAADAVFYIQEGGVKVTVVSDQGKEAVVAMQGEGDFFGEGCLNGQPLRLATVAAIAESVIMRLDKVSILRVLHEEPAFSEFFMRHLLARNARVEEDLVDQLFNSSEKRLARCLLLMANFGKEGRPEPVVAKVSQETLAEMIGTTRSRVSYFMNKLRKLGFIEYNGHLVVHTSLLNMVLREKPEIRRVPAAKTNFQRPLVAARLNRHWRPFARRLPGRREPASPATLEPASPPN
jgi:CRP/FNR family transcriptional regulator, cyclic AMP receptor protein